MINEQLAVKSDPQLLPQENLLQREVDIRMKGFTCCRLLRLLAEAVSKYHADCLVDVPHLSPTRLVDVLGLLASITDDHRHSLCEGHFLRHDINGAPLLLLLEGVRLFKKPRFLTLEPFLIFALRSPNPPTQVIRTSKSMCSWETCQP